MKKDVARGVVAAAILGAVTFLVLITLLSGVVFMQLWGWFVVQTFHAPSLHLAQAIGIALVVRYLTYQTPMSKQEGRAPFGEQLATSIAALLFLWGIAWVVHLFL